MLEDVKGMKFAYALKYDFPISNNESKYESLLAGLQIALSLQIEQLIIREYSKSMFGHVTGSFEVKIENRKKIFNTSKSIIVQIDLLQKDCRRKN